MCSDYSSALASHPEGADGGDSGSLVPGVGSTERTTAHLAVMGHAVGGMTSRISPVGVIVIVLASLAAVGCSTQTGAVFQDLLDPVQASASQSGSDEPGDAASDDGSEPSWWTHPDDGYAMVLPAGWSGAAVGAAGQTQLIDAVEVSHPQVAERIQEVLGATSSRMSALAVDVRSNAEPPPLMLVLAQPTEGRKARAVKLRVEEQIAGLPGLLGVPNKTDERLPAAHGVSFDFVISDPDLGELRATSYLFRFGSQAYLVSFVATRDGFDGVEAVFESIAQSLRFGV